MKWPAWVIGVREFHDNGRLAVEKLLRLSRGDAVRWYMNLKDAYVVGLRRTDTSKPAFWAEEVDYENNTVYFSQ